MSGDGYPTSGSGTSTGGAGPLVRTTNGDSTYAIPATSDAVATSATFTASRAWTLPAAATFGTQQIVISDDFGGVTSTNTLVVTRAGSDTINGGTTMTIAKAYGFVCLQSDGVSKWTIVAADCLTSPVLATPVINGLPTGTGVASAATVSTLASRDSSGNTALNNILLGYATTATAAGTTTLTVSSKHHQFFTGTTTQTVELPGMATMTAGTVFRIANQSTGILTVNAAGSVFLHYVFPGYTARFTSLGNLGFEGASWMSESTQSQVFVKSADFSAIMHTAGPSTFLVDTSGGNVTATLPSSAYDGRWCTIIKTDPANKLTIDRNGNNINGVAANLTFVNRSQGATFQWSATYGWATIPNSMTQEQIIQFSRMFAPM